MRFQRAMRWFGKASGAIGASAAVFGVLWAGLAAAAPEDGSVQTASAPPPAQAPQPQSLSEGVVASVNDEVISTYDVIQRMRLLIVTSGIQPTDQNIPQMKDEAVRSLIDERLEMQELRHEGKTQKFDLVAGDDEDNDEIADIARQNNTSADQLMSQLAAQGVGAETFREQLRAEISWRGWIRGRYGSRVRIGEDQIKAYQARLVREKSKPHYQIRGGFIDTARAGGPQAAITGANQLMGELQKSDPFAALARPVYACL